MMGTFAGTVIVWALLIVLVLVYLIPIIIAHDRRVNRFGAVVVVDLLLGWTFLGWAVALAMAVGMDRKDEK
jgi:hypothetical protein